MRIDSQLVGAVTVLGPHGPLVQDDAEAFASRLATAMDRSMGRLVVDLAAVPFADSRGLEVLADAAAELQSTGQSLRLAGANETVRTVFEITELAPVFDHYHDVNSAVRSFL